MDATSLAFAGAAEQARLIRAGEVSALELTELMLDRIQELDPVLNSFRVVLAERALAEAEQADARRRGGDERPLLGVPVAIKDDTDVAGEVTAWGTAAYGRPKERDAEVVRRLRAAGAIVIGKTLVPEMTLLPATDTTTFGAARNPWDLHRTPGGSSGGSAAATAAGLCGVALGSDGGGSIRMPSAWCGLFGLKTTRGRVPIAPHVDSWQGMSVYGPIARRVADAALFLDATADDPPEGGFTSVLAAEPRRLRIGVSTKGLPGVLFRLGADQRSALEATAEALRGLGHEVVEREPDYPGSAYLAANVRIMRGAWDDVRDYMPHPERLEPRTRQFTAMGRALPEAVVAWARRAEREQARRLGALWDDVDVLLQPTAPTGPDPAGSMGRRTVAGFSVEAPKRVAYCVTWNLTGQPSASVPAGFDRDGLPVGVQLIGRRDDDALLLQLAAQLEQARPWAERRPPAA